MLLIIVLERDEEQFPAVREIIVSAMCLCVYRGVVSSYSENFYIVKDKILCRNHMILFILCGL